MAYNGTISFYLIFVAVMLAPMVVMHFLRRKRAISSGIAWGLIGSAAGYFAGPPLAMAAGLLPDIMLQREYFARQFPGCISPAAFVCLFATSTLSVFSGFALGFWLRFTRALP